MLIELMNFEYFNQSLVSFSDDGKRINYCYLKKSYRADPEEFVRAEYYLALVEKYEYEPSRIDLEVLVPRRIPSDYADIVVFEDDELKQPYIVVECKRDGISDAEFEQAIEQMFGNSNSLRSKFGAVIAGNTRRFFDVSVFKPAERRKNIIADIPINYGIIQEYRFKKGIENWDLKPVEKDTLILALDKCHDSLWDGGRMDPTEAFDEMTKLLFVKMQDELAPKATGQPYEFQIKSNETPQSVYQRITELYDKAKINDPDVFVDSISSSPEKIFSVVNHIEGINLIKTDLDTKGVAFERFMEDFFKGKQGQYFTPREIVKFIVEVCDIDSSTSILDPACGSGGFLLYAMNQIREKASEFYDAGSIEQYRYWHDFASKKLYGIEINGRISRIAKMNMIIHDDGHSNVICHDSLESIEKLNSENQGIAAEKFDLILTNPPFGASIKSKEKDYMKNFSMGYTANRKVREKQQSEILFIERCWQFLKSGGQLAIILPDGILTNHTQKYVRDFILDKFEIKAIVSLPQVTFEHYGAGVKSSVMILSKKYKNTPNIDYNVFFAIVKRVGFDRTGRETENDLLDIPKMYCDYRNGTMQNSNNIFSKPISKLKFNRLDPFYYSPLFDEIERELSNSKYPLKSLKEVSVKGGIFAGKTPAKNQYSDNTKHCAIVKVSSLKNWRVGFNLLHYVKPAVYSNESKNRLKHIIKDGDILLLSAAHQADYIGRNPCIVGPLPENNQIRFVAELICIRVNKNLVNPYYLLQLFTTNTYYLLVNREKRGQTSHIYSRDIQNIKIPIPDLKVQNQSAQQYRDHYANYELYIQKANEVLNQATTEFVELFDGEIVE